MFFFKFHSATQPRRGCCLLLKTKFHSWKFLWRIVVVELLLGLLFGVCLALFYVFNTTLLAFIFGWKQKHQRLWSQVYNHMNKRDRKTEFREKITWRHNYYGNWLNCLIDVLHKIAALLNFRFVQNWWLFKKSQEGGSEFTMPVS